MVVDDHQLMLEGTQEILKREDDFNVVAVAQDGEQAISLALRHQPDVILMDYNLPKKTGVEALEEIREHAEGKHISVLIVSGYDSDYRRFQTLKAGANAYCNKGMMPDELLKIVRLVVSGKCVVDDKVFTRPQLNTWLEKQTEKVHTYSHRHMIIPEYSPTDGSPDELKPALHMEAPLTSRELQILTHITQGASNKEIAHLLNVRPQTIKNHVSNLLNKLEVQDRTQAAVMALRYGWVR
ncbi:MAG: response regulator transcription factor [Chloroflexota bacterium]